MDSKREDKDTHYFGSYDTYHCYSDTCGQHLRLEQISEGSV